MEFKGTKGLWRLKEDSSTPYGGFVLDNSNSIICFILSGVCLGKNSKKREEIRANTLLISKAPEMLEMLQECYKYLPYEGVMRKKVEQLIKQATEL